MLIVTEETCREVVGRSDAFAAVEAVFAAMAKGDAYNFPVVREAIGHEDAEFARGGAGQHPVAVRELGPQVPDLPPHSRGVCGCLLRRGWRSCAAQGHFRCHRNALVLLFGR